MQGGRSPLPNNYPSLAQNSTEKNQSRKAFKSASSSLVLQPGSAELPFLCFSAKNSSKPKKFDRHSKATEASEAGAINSRSLR